MPFKKGQSGNPAGRPKGIGKRQAVFNKFVECHEKELIEKAIQLALDGDTFMLKIFLERLLPPKPADEPIELDLSSWDFNRPDALLQLGKESLRAVVHGEITPEEAVRIASLIGVHYKMFEIIALKEEMEAFKYQLNIPKHSQHPTL